MALPLAIALGGAALSAGAGIYGGVSARNAAKRQATLLNQQADLERLAAEYEAIQSNRQFESLMGEQRLAIAASGSEMEGSALGIIDKTLRDKEETQKNILEAGRAKAAALSDQARQVKKAGKNALFASILGAAGQGFSVAGQYRAGGATNLSPR